MDLIALLTEFGSDQSLIDLVARIGNTETPLTDDELAEIETGLLALADDDEASAALLGAAADAVTTVRGEQQARIDASEAEETERQAAIARMRGEEPEAEGEPAAEAVEGEPAAEGEPEVEPAAEQEPEPVAAGATPRARRTVPRPARTFPTERTEHDGPRIVMGTDVRGFRSGQEVDSLDQVAEAMVARAGSIRPGVQRPRGSRKADHHGSTVDLIPVASIQADFPENRRFTEDGNRNGALVRQALLEGLYPQGGVQALTAAGGFCGIPQPYRGVEVLGDTNRPVRDSLVGFQTANGINFLPPPSLVDVDDSVGVWTKTNDEAADTDPDVVKNVMRITCPGVSTVYIQAITNRFIIGNFQARSGEEYVRGVTDLGLVAHSRLAEQELLDAVKDGSVKPSTVAAEVSFARDLFNTIDQAAEGIRGRNRVVTRPLRVDLPWVVRAMFRRDFTLGLPGGSVGENIGIADAEFDRWFAVRNINVTWNVDQAAALPGAQAAAAALVGFPDTIEFAIYPEGSWLFLDGGTIDLGIVRDNASNAQNDFQVFMETFEGAAFIGSESLWITQDVCITGAAIGTVESAACSGS